MSRAIIFLPQSELVIVSVLQRSGFLLFLKNYVDHMLCICISLVFKLQVNEKAFLVTNHDVLIQFLKVE